MALTAVATSTAYENQSLELTYTQHPALLTQLNEPRTASPDIPISIASSPPLPALCGSLESVCTRFMTTGEPTPVEQSKASGGPIRAQASIVLHYPDASTVKYTIDEDILCKLPFFAGALREGFRETVTKLVNMPEDDPELVICLLQYLHTGDYVPPPSSISAESTASRKKEVRLQRKLFHTSVFILADKYMCIGLCKLAALNIRKIVLSPMSFVNYMVAVYEMTPPGSRLRISYFVEYGYRDELLVIHPQWTISSHTRASITRLLEAQSTEDKFVEALDRCPQLAVDLLSLISKGQCPVEQAILQCPGAAKVILLHHCKQFYDKRPWTSTGELVRIPWGWWKGC